VPAAFWSFADTWQTVFREGVVDHAVKELCRVYVSRSVKCEYCGNQRSVAAAAAGLEEGKYDDLMNFESSALYGDREKAALAYAETITWRLSPNDELWDRLYKHFSEAELVELGYFIATTMGQQSWLRLLNIDHHQVLAGTSASMAPGFEDAEALARSKQSDRYWAKK
jgi:alkylhydroperoxidase family enzyme